MFEVGREIEVSFDEEYCRDTWFPATILEDLGNGRFLTEYCRSVTNETKPLKVAVNSLHIRPCPPLLKDKRFALLEKVDAYFNFGWWSGVITRELEDNKYIIFFQQSRKEKEFDHSLLRPHMEWKDGNWFPSQGVSVMTPVGVPLEPQTHENLSGTSQVAPTNNSEKKSSFAVHNKANNQFQKLTSSVERPHGTRSLVQKRMSLSDLHDTPSQHPKRRKESILLEGNQKDRHRRSSSKLLSGCVSPGSPDNMISFTVHPSSDSPSSGKITTRKKGNVGSIGDHGKAILASCSKKSSEQILQGGSPETRVAGKGPDAVRITEDDVLNGNGRKETECPVFIVGLPCPITESTDVGVSSGEKSLRSITKELMMKHVDVQMQQQLDCAAIENSKDSKLLDATGVIGEKRKRGRPRKTPPKSLQTRISGSARSLGTVGYDISGQDSNPHGTPDMAATENLVDGRKDPMNRENVALRAVAKADVEKASSGSIMSIQQENSSKRGRPKSDGGKSTQANDTLDARNPTTLKPGMAVDKSITKVLEDNDLDDEPLSTWIQRVQSPVDGSGTSPVSTVEQCTDERVNLDTDAVVPVGDKVSQKNTEKEVSSSMEKGSTGPGEEPILHSKQSVIWGTIESMEVFQRLPQNPHFAPLKNFKESSREGLAIGYMVTFSSVVEKASNLQFSDPVSVTDDILETLEDLEKHGFDVAVVRDRVTSLLAVKENHGNLAKEADVLNDQFLEHSSEKSRMEEEIQETSEQIRKLQEKLSLAESAKETEDGEINNLQARLTEIKEIIMNAEQEFNAVASAALE